MVCDEVKPHHDFFLIFPVTFHDFFLFFLGPFYCNVLIPFLDELFLCDESAVLDSCIFVVYRSVSFGLKVLVDFSDIPLESNFSIIIALNLTNKVLVERHKLIKGFGYQFLFVVTVLRLPIIS